MKKYDVIDLIKNKYLSSNKADVLKHVEDVSDIAVKLAMVYNLDVDKIKLAAWLHDISGIMTPQEMDCSSETILQSNGTDRRTAEHFG